EVAEHRVVVEPHDADDREADEEGGVRGPLVPQAGTEVLEVVGRGDREHEQRDGDREHAVTERLEASLAHGQPLCRLTYVEATCSRSLCFITFPVALRGSSVTNHNFRGRL